MRVSARAVRAVRAVRAMRSVRAVRPDSRVVLNVRCSNLIE
jgi:hypothetical protein